MTTLFNKPKKEDKTVKTKLLNLPDAADAAKTGIAALIRMLTHLTTSPKLFGGNDGTGKGNPANATALALLGKAYGSFDGATKVSHKHVAAPRSS